MEESNKYFEIETVKISVGRKRLAKLFGFLLLSALYFLQSVSSAEAASLFLSPETGSFNVGQTFSVSVFVSSPDQTMNAADGVISFPANKLQVISLSKSASLFSLWVKEPSFSNSVGTLSFEGVVLNPGFAGSAGKLLTITFRAEDAGSAPVSFSSGSILANDGRGTNILTSLESANYFINSSLAEQAPVETALLNTPAAPPVSSPTHPDSNKWYSLRNANFTWPLAKGIIGTRIIATRYSDATPNKSYMPAIDSKGVTDLEDGVWYFNVQLRNKKGWGEITRFRLQVDATPPESFTIKEIERPDLTASKVKFLFNASDSTSGIDHYEVRVDGRSAETWKDDGSHTYETPILDPGSHSLNVKAVDKAGNYLSESHEFSIEKRQVSPLPVLLIVLIILIVILAVSLIYIWYRFVLLKRKLRGDLKQTESNLRSAFRVLHQEVRRQIRSLNNVRSERELTAEELRLIEELEHALDSTELMVAKELDKLDEIIK